MAAFIVAYDLHTPGQNYQCLKEELESYPTHWHIQGSVWIVQSSKNAYEIATELEGCLDSNDKLLVTEMGQDTAWSGYSSENSAWLKRVI